jgi:WD40 repeat protein
MDRPVWLLLPENRSAFLAMPDGRFAGLAFSPADPRTIALARGPIVHVWVAIGGSNEARAQLRHQLTHAADVVDVGFSDDGALILGADQADTVRIWSAGHESVALVRVLRARGHRIASARFSADRRQVLTAGADGTARLWEIPKEPREDKAETCKQCRATADWLTLAESRVTRTFTSDERKRYGLLEPSPVPQPR